MSADARRQFLGGWGAAIAVVVGIAIARVAAGVLEAAWFDLDSTLKLSEVGLTLRLAAGGAILAIGWTGFWAIVLYFLPGGDVVLRGLRSGVGDWKTEGRVILAFALSGSVWFIEPSRPANALYDTYFGVGGMPWVSLFQGTPRWWWTWVILAGTVAFVFAIERRRMRFRNEPPASTRHRPNKRIERSPQG